MMDQAESLLSEAPDSALAILSAIPNRALSTRSICARHALLTAMAEDKCYVTETEDSTIRVAYDWYKHHGSKLPHLQAAYYYGIVQENIGKDAQAVLLFLEAKTLAEILKEYRWLSLCNQHLRVVYSNNYDRLKAMEHAQRSLEAAMWAEDALMIDYCLLDVADEYLAQGKLDTAEVLYKRIISEGGERVGIVSYASRSLANLYLFQPEPDYDKAQALYHSILTKGDIELTCQDYGHLGLLAECQGNPSLSDYYCTMAEQVMFSPIDSVTYYTIRTNLYDLRGEYKLSNESYGKAMAIQNRVVYTQLEQSITHSLEQYYQEEAELEKQKNRTQFLLFFMFGLLLMGAILWLIGRLRKTRLDILEKMAQIKDFNSDLVLLQSKESESRLLLDYYTKDKIHSLNTLASAYFSWDSQSVRQKEKNTGSRTKDEMREEFQKQLESFRQDASFYASLEKSLNVTYNGIMLRAREEIKNERNIDIDLLILFFFGFSAKSICFLKNMTESSVWMRKTRIKKFFASLPDNRGAEFVQRLQQEDSR